MEKILLPKYYVIEPTNYCNFECPICPNRLIKNKEKGYMSLDLFNLIIDQISDVAEVIQLYWLGEPLLHPDIYKMIRLCKEKSKAKIMISTNGSLLTRENIENLVKSNIDEIIISVDADDSQKIYNQIRTGGSIKQLNESILLFLKYKRDTQVVLQFIDLFVNKSERDGFESKWDQKDCSINISCVYSWANQLPSLNLTSDNLSPVIYKKREPCADLWNKMVINWNGMISACCFDWNSKLIFGDSKVDSLEKIWNNQQISKIRELHSMKKFSKIQICNKCDSWAEYDEYTDLFHL